LSKLCGLPKSLKVTVPLDLAEDTASLF